MALLPPPSGCMNVAQPLVVQKSRLPACVRRMRRRADARWLKLV
jgi:hypothetical protein